MLRIVLACMTLMACQVDGELDGQFRCSENPSCPDGYQCVAGLCVGIQPGLTACATPDLLATAFDDAQWLDAMDRNVSPGGSAAIVGGELVLQAPPANNQGAWVKSKAAFDLRGRALVVEVTQVGGRYAEIELDDPSNAQVYMGVAEGKLYAYGKGRKLAERPYSDTQDRWWRLREESGSVFWDTSPDGETWTAMAQDLAPVDAAWVEVGFGVESSGAAATARFATVTPPGPSTSAEPRWCPASTWRQSFSDGIKGPEENDDANNCTQTEAGGVLTFTTGAAGESYCGRYSARPVDARDAVLTFEVVPASSPTYTTFTLQSPDDKNRVQIEAQNELSFDIRAAGVDVFSGSAALDAATQRFWRLTLAGANVRFETSATGASWDLRGSTTVPTLDASSMFIERELYINGSNTAVRTAQFGELR